MEIKKDVLILKMHMKEKEHIVRMDFAEYLRNYTFYRKAKLFMTNLCEIDFMKDIVILVKVDGHLRFSVRRLIF